MTSSSPSLRQTVRSSWQVRFEYLRAAKPLPNSWRLGTDGQAASAPPLPDPVQASGLSRTQGSSSERVRPSSFSCELPAGLRPSRLAVDPLPGWIEARPAHGCETEGHGTATGLA